MGLIAGAGFLNFTSRISVFTGGGSGGLMNGGGLLIFVTLR